MLQKQFLYITQKKILNTYMSICFLELLSKIILLIYYKYSVTLLNASAIPSGFLPPAVAKNGCPPPPPCTYLPYSLTIFPASNPLAAANSLLI